MYFEFLKDKQIGNLTGSYNMEDQLKLPIIHNNIQKKYNYPLIEKTNPTVSIYNAIKNMIDENQNLSRSLNINKKKLDILYVLRTTTTRLYTLSSLYHHSYIYIYYEMEEKYRLYGFKILHYLFQPHS